jgi:iron complex transport system substrate-binding protein
LNDCAAEVGRVSFHDRCSEEFKQYQVYLTGLGKAISALVLVSRQLLLSPNKNSWAGDFLTQFKLQNVTADLQGQSPIDGYVTLSAEKVLATNPDVLMIVDTGDDLLNQLQKDPFWGELKAAQAETVYGFDYFGLINPGSLASS